MNLFEIILAVGGLILFTWILWQVKKFEGFIDTYDYRDYQEKKPKKNRNR